MEQVCNKVRLLKALEILKRESDEERPLTLLALAKKLEEEGYPSDRKTLARDLKAMVDAGYDVMKANGPDRGFFITKRSDFETAEARLLLDAVLTAPFLTEKKTKQLSDRIKSLVSDGQSAELFGQVFFDRTVKCRNEEIYYNIDTLCRAISQKRKVSLLYSHQRLQNGKPVLEKGRRFVLSPYALLWSKDKYYLACNYEKYDTVGNYRLDRMRQVRVTEEPARPFEEVSPYRERFDCADYLRRTFYMYSGEKTELVLRCEESALELMLDRFGGNMKPETDGEGAFTARVTASVSEGLYEWLMQYGTQITVLAPAGVREEIRKRLLKMQTNYAE